MILPRMITHMLSQGTLRTLSRTMYQKLPESSAADIQLVTHSRTIYQELPEASAADMQTGRLVYRQSRGIHVRF